MESPSPSAANPAPTPEPSSAYQQLHPEIQRWIWGKNWPGLREIQEASIPPILDGKCDVILEAGTSSGKTEAAMLPVLTRIASDGIDGSVRAMYIGPLKALINDQFMRLEFLCEKLSIPVTKWHGDASDTAKKRLRANPAGVLLITPESLEAVFARSGHTVSKMFGHLAYIVIDELHAFVGTERGRQLQSLMHRMDIALRRRVQRIGLSATLGDKSIAAEFLRPGFADRVVTLSCHGSQTIEIQVKGYEVPNVNPQSADEDSRVPSRDQDQDVQFEDISAHLFGTLRGSNNLIFANSRNDVEIVSDRLARRSELNRVPNEFFPHHGKLAKDIREQLEAALKDKDRHISAVCTSTLEMGIDIGDIKSVAQVGVPPSVAALRQRIGRSGRRGDPSVLRVYIRELEIGGNGRVRDILRLQLIQAIAMIELIVERWNEPPARAAPHFSTLVHQILSLIAQHGGVRADEAFRALCKGGPFAYVTQADFMILLQGLGREKIIEQAGDGTLLCGPAGERIVNHYSFYAVFHAEEEFRLVYAGRTLGTMPVSSPLDGDQFIIFAGKRWRILSVHDAEKLIELAPAPASGLIPPNQSPPGDVHDRVREQMRQVLSGVRIPSFLDSKGRALLGEARVNFASMQLHESSIAQHSQGPTTIAWKGTKICNTLALGLKHLGLRASPDGGPDICVSGASVDKVQSALAELATSFPAPDALVKQVQNLRVEKFDNYLPIELLQKEYAVRRLDIAGAQALAAALIKQDSRSSDTNSPETSPGHRENPPSGTTHRQPPQTAT